MATSPSPRTHRASAQRRRAALLEAARELIGEIGAGAITHRAVAQRAGVPLSTTSYFFDSIDELVTEALRDQRHAQVEAFDAAERLWVLNDGESTRELLDRIAEHLTARSPANKAANAEALLAAARNPELGESVRAVFTRFHERLSALGGEPTAETDLLAWALLTFSQGASLYQLAGIIDGPTLADGYELLVAGALLGPEGRAELLGRFDATRRDGPTFPGRSTSGDDEPADGA